MTLHSLRHAVVVVQQDSFLFTTSLENNIAYGDPWAAPGRIKDASATAQLHQFIATLPAGYETVVGERGASLSGGQRQRMTIARALMLKPAVLIFDDSTAAVDANTERRIFAPKPSLYAGPAFGRSSSGVRPKEGAHGAEGRYPQPDQPAVRLCIPHPLSDGDRRMRQGGAGTAERRCRSRQRLHSHHVKFSPAACPHRRNPTRGKPLPTMTLDKRQGYCVLSTYVMSTTYKWNRWTPLRKEKQRNATFCI